MEGFEFPVDTLSSSEGVFAPPAMPESELKAWMIRDSQPMLPSLAALPPGSQFNSDLKTGGWQAKCTKGGNKDLEMKMHFQEFRRDKNLKIAGNL
jgi:hypothetical protein